MSGWCFSYDHWKYPLVSAAMSFRFWFHCGWECELCRMSRKLLRFDGRSLTNCVTFSESSGVRGEDEAEEPESSLLDQLGSRVKVGQRAGRGGEREVHCARG